MTVDDLLTWLRAQLDDDERMAKAAADPDDQWWWSTPESPAEEHIARYSPARALAEVDAKRRILDAVLKYEAVIDGEWGDGHTAEQIADGLCPETDPDEIPAVKLLALPYADRPDYRPEWAPST